MKQTTHFTAAAIIVALLIVWGLTAPSGTDAIPSSEPPSSVEHIDGSELSRVHLTQRAAERLDIQTGQIQDATVNGAAVRTIPYSAVLYDAEGNAWTYTNPEPLVYIRAPLMIDRIDGDVAILIDGPGAGTAVVTVGAAMLYGTEFGVGH